ncbi:alcohol oxidase [Mytilinidion resinicola]|uniref:Alcohol oxidase n=1 Tax=Mytilinidion resinicola TaxID=574789 RepID=A0A6A6Z2Q0_9PEZI|nr:alcohol oxidase [Mytilinidion resinicola]KAF2814507.1 alcohol oxidase [Mytilinidion resinicola]
MRWTPIFTALSGLGSGASAIFGATKANGRTRLFGNAFGILAENVTYDYVVVGGGTAGLATASRLAASSANVTVAVIEAGSFYELDNGNTSVVPGYGAQYLSFNDLEPSPVLVDWGIITEPQEGFGGRKIHYSAGKKCAYDTWSDLVGDSSFTWDKFLPYLKKSVKFTPPNLDKIGRNVSIPYDPEMYSPTGGPLEASFPNFRAAFDQFMVKAFNETGFKPIDGLNSGHLDGFAPSTLAVSAEFQTRSSSEASFLQEALDTTALKLYLRTLAKKIVFDGKKAKGVLVETNGAEYTISAKEEVIVSSGVFHSPHLLLLSGIGPADALSNFSIPVVSDLAGVGKNMWDHLFIFTSHETNVTTNSGVTVNETVHAEAVEAYLSEQTGPLTGVGGGVLGWEKLPNRSSLSPETQDALATFADDFPELEYLGLSPGSNPPDKPAANNYMSVTVAVQTILSRGSVTLRSADPHERPIVDVNAMSTKAEEELAVGAIKRLRELARATGVWVSEVEPGPNVVTDAEILEWVRKKADNGYHASSTCSMGKKDDKNAVVDTRGRVYGVEGLRVVDTSIFPLLPAGHPMSTIYALSELIAEDIISGIS